MARTIISTMLVFWCVLLARPAAAAQHAGCHRPAAGTVIPRPPDLYSQHGTLTVALDYVTSVDSEGRTLFCFQTSNGLESPTLHVRPGDRLEILLNNRLPPLPAGTAAEELLSVTRACGDRVMDATSVNIHFHGTNTSPRCHADGVIHTLVDAGHSFRYALDFPRNEPPGLYWYHPHVHGITEAAVQGGASGAIIVEGIAEAAPQVARLPERLLIVRDQVVVVDAVANKAPPAADLTVNYVPVPYPAYLPAILDTLPGRGEFWRVLNAGAVSVLDLELRFDGRPQPLELVGLDGVPVNSAGPGRQGQPIRVGHVLLPPASRAEFIVPAVPPGVHRAELVTRSVDTGPDGDADPPRALIVLRASATHDTMTEMPGITEPTTASNAIVGSRFDGLDQARVSAVRKLYFSEDPVDPSDPNSDTEFFITVEGAKPTLFDPVNPPAITTTQGSTEDWTIENRTGEHHEFHIHQIHFKLLARDGIPVPPDERQMLDVVQVPYWSGHGPYPSVTVRMDFRGPDVGDFVYHCHILEHEDKGMMAIIRVLPSRSREAYGSPGGW